MARKKKSSTASRMAGWMEKLAPSLELRRAVRRYATYAFTLLALGGGVWASLRVKAIVEASDVFV